MTDADSLTDHEVLALANTIIQSHPNLFADSGLPNDGELAGVTVAKRAALFVKTLKEELRGILTIEQAQTPGERIVEHLRSHPGTVQMTTDEIMALTRGED